MAQKHKKSRRTLNYFEHFLLFISSVTGCVSIFAFDSLVDVHVGINGSAVEFKISAITARLKKYQSIIKKQEKEA